MYVCVCVCVCFVSVLNPIFFLFQLSPLIREINTLTVGSGHRRELGSLAYRIIVMARVSSSSVIVVITLVAESEIRHNIIYGETCGFYEGSFSGI